MHGHELSCDRCYALCNDKAVSVTSLSEVRKGDRGMSRADPYLLPLKRHSLEGQVSRSTAPWVRRVGEAMRVVADDAVDAVAGTWAPQCP